MVMGSNHSFEPLARTLAVQTNATVVSVDYRLAPEFPAPAQFDDAYTATEWVAGHAEQLAVDVTRLAVVGDSAGGSLAAAVALAARDRGGPAICCQVLLYPGLDRDMTADRWSHSPKRRCSRHDDILYMHELADAGSGAPHDQYRVPAYADGPERTAARHSRYRRMRSDPKLGRALRDTAARRGGANHRHTVSRRRSRVLDAVRYHRPRKAGDRRGVRPAAGEVRQPGELPDHRKP